MTSTLVALRRRVAIVMLTALVVGACVKPATELVVVVDTDFTVPGELDEVSVTVIGPSGAQTQTRVDLSATGAPTLPLTLGLVPASDSLGPVTVIATGRLRAHDVVSQTRRTNFLRGESRTLTLVLHRGCAGVSCPDAQSCNEAVCSSVDVAASSLPVWTGTATRFDGGARDASRDVAQMVDSGFDVATTDADIDVALDADIDASGDAEADVTAEIAAADVRDVPISEVVLDGCVPQGPEVCNGRDDNCNGMIDETFDLSRDPANCGMCGRSCVAPHSAASCTAGTCALVCDPGFGACDAVPSNGCETPLTTVTNCGMCARACSPAHATPACTAGACAIASCNAAWNDCDGNAANGCEAIFSATTSCGRCNHACIGAATCASGACSDDSPAQISAGGDLACVRRTSGAVSCWGDNSEGQLGDGTLINRSVPVDVLGLTDAIQISTRAHSGCAIRRGGTVVCWGLNSDGQLGNGTVGLPQTRPVTVTGLMDAVEIAVGRHHACARRLSGAVVCWGRNLNGQLGDGTVTGRTTPTAVIGLVDAVQIASYGYTTCARRMTGALVCWGTGTTGAVGDGSGLDRHTPVVVTGVADAVEVVLGYEFACARRSTGAVVCWGMSDLGQMGDGTTAPVMMPRLAPGANVIGLSDAVQITAGHDHVCARRASGAMLCWGANGSGQLGDGSRVTTRTIPVIVSGITDAVEIANGDSASCARRATRAVVCWGDNLVGQIGNGSASPVVLPPTAVTYIP